MTERPSGPTRAQARRVRGKRAGFLPHRSSPEWTLGCQPRDRRFESGMRRHLDGAAPEGGGPPSGPRSRQETKAAPGHRSKALVAQPVERWPEKPRRRWFESTPEHLRFFVIGGRSSAGERLSRIQKARGSNPLDSIPIASRPVMPDGVHTSVSPRTSSGAVLAPRRRGGSAGILHA